MVKKLRKIIVHIYPTHYDRCVAFQKHCDELKAKDLLRFTKISNPNFSTCFVQYGEEDHKFMTEDQVERGHLQGMQIDEFSPPQPHLSQYLNRYGNLVDD